MEKRSRDARDRRASMGEAGDASRRKVIGELGRTAQWRDAADAGRIAAPVACRVMRVHFGDRTAGMHHEHSDTPDVFVTSHDPSFCAEAEYALTVDPQMRLLGSSRGRRKGDNDTSERQPSVLVVDDTYRITPGVPNSLPFFWAFPKSIKALLVCDSPPQDFTEDHFEYGCRGMISRGELDRDLLKAVRAVAAGELWMPRRMFARLLERASEMSREKTILFATSPHGALTVRENKVASYAVRGLTNKEIARALSISDKTVKTHMSRILHKLGLARRQQLNFGTGDRQSLLLPASTRMLA